MVFQVPTYLESSLNLHNNELFINHKRTIAKWESGLALRLSLVRWDEVCAYKPAYPPTYLGYINTVYILNLKTIQICTLSSKPKQNKPFPHFYYQNPNCLDLLKRIKE